MHFLTKGATNCPGSYLSQRARGGVSVVVSTPRTLWIANRLCNSKVMRRATLPPVIFLHLGARGALLSRRRGYCFCLGCDSSLLWGRWRPAPSPSAPLSYLKAPLAAILPICRRCSSTGRKRNMTGGALSTWCQMVKCTCLEFGDVEQLPLQHL